MKMWIPLLAVAVLLAGCSGVILSPAYSQLLDKTAALSADTAARANAGTLDPNQMKVSLTAQAATWFKFVQARDGKKVTP